MAEWACPRCQRTFHARNVRHACNSQAPEAFFASNPGALPRFRAVQRLIASFGPHEMEATMTQVAFRGRKRFAFLWFTPRKEAELVLTFDLRRRIRSPKIRESVEIRPGLWTHHVVLETVGDLDGDVRGWLREAYETFAPARQRDAPSGP